MVVVDSRIEAEVKAQAEREKVRAEYKQRRHQAEAEERERQQMAVRLKDDRGYEWNEIHAAVELQQQIHRDSETRRLKTYSNRAGHLDRAYEIIHMQPTQPAKKKNN
jgi:hypothetical protein